MNMSVINEYLYTQSMLQMPTTLLIFVNARGFLFYFKLNCNTHLSGLFESCVSSCAESDKNAVTVTQRLACFIYCEICH